MSLQLQQAVFSFGLLAVWSGPHVYVHATCPDPFARCKCKHAAGKKIVTKTGGFEIAPCPFVTGREDGETKLEFIRRRKEQCICKHKFDCDIVRRSGIPPYLAPGDGFVPMNAERTRWIKHEGSSTQTKDGIPNPEFDALAWRPKVAA